MQHELKIKPEYYNAVLFDKKRFEIRKFDRPFKVGDTLLLREWENGAYTGRSFTVKIRYILSDCPDYGLMQGYCILGF